MKKSTPQQVDTNFGKDHPDGIDFLAILVTTFYKKFLTLIITAIALATITLALYYFGVSPRYSSDTYLKITKEDYPRFNAILQSPLVIDSAASTAGVKISSLDRARNSMRANISFRPAPGEDNVNANIYLLEVKDKDAKIAHDVAVTIVDKWFEAFKPRPDEAKRLENDLARQTKALSELDSVIASFSNGVTTYIAPETNSGELATPMVALIAQRTKLDKGIEDLQIQLNGLSRDIVLVPPTIPDDANRAIGILTVFAASLIAAFTIILCVFALRASFLIARSRGEST